MPQDNICVSAFGFHDVVCINGRNYTVPEHIPSVVIEDREHKFSMYSHDAIFERTGMGLNNLGDYTTRIPVCILWQQLSQLTASDQYDAAKRLSKYVISLIIHAYSELKLTGEHEIINKGYLRTHAQITLCIPDYFDESEQQCLLDAFEGLNFRLLWRSVAAIIGSFNYQAPLHAYSKEQLITVCYLGPDSFDITSYGYSLGDDGYVIPIRKKPVYDSCSLPINFPLLAISNANHLIVQNILPHERLTNQTYLSLLSQLFFNSPLSWMDLPEDFESDDADFDNCEVLGFNTSEGNKWYTIYGDYNGLLQNINRQAKLNSAEFFMSGYQLNYNLSQIKDKIISVKDYLRESFTNLFKRATQSQGTNPYIIFTGAFANNLIAQNVFSHISPQMRSVHNMAEGGCVFNERFDLGLPTYLDSMRKLSMVSRNNSTDEYFEKELIKAGTVEPYSTFTSDTIYQRITKGSDKIELYVSSDENFNSDNIEKATSESFKELGIEVFTAAIPFKGGLEAKDEETVAVTVEQKVLSGYVKMLIKPLGKSKVLPPFGVTAAFDPNTKTIYEGTLPMLNRRFPALVKPKLKTNSNISTVSSIFSLVFSSSNKKTPVVYYDEHFVSSRVEHNVKAQIDQQLKQIANIIDRLPTNYDARELVNKVRFTGFLLLTSVQMLNNPLYMQLVQYFDNILTLFESRFHQEVNGIDKHTVLRFYGRMVPDTIEHSKRCVYWIERNPLFACNSQGLYDIRIFIENHPRSFSGKGQNFAMTHGFSQVLLQGSATVLTELADKDKYFDSETVFKSFSITGCQMLTRALAVMMYALLWRKADRNYLATDADVEDYISALNKVKTKIHNLHEYFQTAEVLLDRRPNAEMFRSRVDKFVSSSLNVLDGVIDYLHNKGTNTNIMANIDELEESEGKMTTK